MSADTVLGLIVGAAASMVWAIVFGGWPRTMPRRAKAVVDAAIAWRRAAAGTWRAETPSGVLAAAVDEYVGSHHE
jgi:hypothetical protein